MVMVGLVINVAKKTPARIVQGVTPPEQPRFSNF